MNIANTHGDDNSLLEKLRLPPLRNELHMDKFASLIFTVGSVVNNNHQLNPTKDRASNHPAARAGMDWPSRWPVHQHFTFAEPHCPKKP